ncbi:MAG: glycosyltransferase [Smithella sp.]|nr:glycosyltransferase [Smithella sp.]
MKKVSVIIPLYNAEKYIEDALLSVLNQTYKNIETIIVDDGSTDHSLTIARKYESETVKIYTQPNAGACRARNFAFEKSTGDYIQYLDADDILAPNKIETQVNILEAYGSDAVTWCGHTRNYEDFKKGLYIDQGINRDYSNPVELFVDNFNGKGNIITLCWLTPRQLIEQSDSWDERLTKSQDGEFFIRVALKCKKIIFSKDTTVLYRLTGQTSIAANQSNKAIESVIMSAESSHKTILKYENSDRVRNALISQYSKVFCRYYNKRNSLVLTRLESNIKQLGGRLQYNGNRFIGLLAKIVGIKNALTLRNILKKRFQIHVY